MTQILCILQGCRIKNSANYNNKWKITCLDNMMPLKPVNWKDSEDELLFPNHKVDII